MDLLNQFKDFLFSQKDLPAKVTVKNYLSDVNHFIRWYESHYQKSFAPQLITHGIIEAYKKEVSGENESNIQNTKYQILSSSSMDRHLSSLRKFFKFLKLEGLTSLDPFVAHIANLQAQTSDPWHIKDFKNYLYVYNASHLTIKNYIIDTRQFFTWAENVTGANDTWNTKDKNILNKIDNSLLEEYKNRLADDGNFSPATVNRKLSSLRKYLNWAMEEGLVSGISYPASSIQDQQNQTKNVRLELQQFSNEAIEQLPENRQSSIVNRQSYSHFPPLRLIQKISKIGIFAFDQFLTLPFAKAFDKVSYLAWLAKGSPVFQRLKTSDVRLKRPNLKSYILNQKSFDVKNIKKEFYAPLEISTKYFPWYKKTWFTLRYKRPKWYTTYHSYPIAHYFNFAVLIIFMAVIGFGFYQSFFQKPTTGQPTLAAGLPNAPLHILSFQGRLTDNQDNPISTSSAMRFAIYNAQVPATGSALLWQEVNSVSPDQDGIFSILLGNVSPIPQWLFASNSALFLGVTVNVTPELTPRQQLATVAFAANSELLQGLPPITQAAAGTSNVVLALDSSGNLTIGGSANPTFQASGGQFTISGQPLLLTTNTGSNGNVQLAPDGTGFIDLAKPIVNTSNSNNIASAVGSVEIDDLLSVLATSSGQSAVTINQTGGGPLISASQSGTAKFTVDGSGNVTIASGSIYSVGTSTGLSLTNACVNTTGGIVTGTGTCPTQTGTNWWNQLAGALSPVNTTNDFLLGSTATSSALFSFTGIKTGQTIASASGNLIIMPNNGWGGDVGIGYNNPGTATLAVNGNVGIGTTAPNAGLHVASNAIFQNASDSTTAFQLLNSAGNRLFNADTSGSKVTLDPVGAYSDDFNTGGPTAASRWSFVTNDASTYSVNSAAPGKLRISPADTSSHDCWTGGSPTCLRLVQTPPTGDFQADIKLDTLPPNGSSVYSSLGIIVYKDTTNFLRFELQSYGDGSSWIVRGYKIIANVGSTAVSSTTLTGLTTPFYLRVKRTADTWTLYYSTDGNNLISAGSFTQALDLSVAGSKIGPMLDNYPAGTTFTNGDFDYFHLTTAAGTILQVNGGAVFQNTLDSTTAFQIKNAAGTGVLAVDTTNSNVGIGTTAPLVTLDVRGNSGTLAVASISGKTSFAALISNNDGLGDLFSASSSGVNKFTVQRNGLLLIPTYNNAGGILYTSTTGLINQTGIGTGAQCLLGGTAPTWGACGGTAGVNWWNQLAGALSPVNTTNDLLLGSTATSSALFSFTGIKTGQTIASVSGQLIVMPNNGWGGNVGIGTTGPLSTLSVGGVGISGTGVYSTASGVGVYGVGSGTGTGVYGINSSSGTGVVGVNSGTGYGVYAENSSSGIGGYFSSASGYALVTGTGNVGIGTTAPTTKLQVGGTLGTSVIASVSGQLIVMPNGGWGGQVGIGTTTPGRTLDLYGAKIADGNLSSQVLIRDTSAYNANPVAGIEFALKVNSAGGYIGAGGISVGKENATDSDTRTYLSLYTVGANFSGQLERLRIDSNGNVGIGVNPYALLHIDGGKAGGNAALIVNQTGNSANDIFTASSSGTTQFKLTNAGSIYARSFYDLDNTLYFLDPAATGTSLAVLGSVGIGTTSPNGKVDIRSGGSALTNTTGKIYLGQLNGNTDYVGFIFQGIATSDMFFGRTASSDDLVISTGNTGSPSEKVRFTQSGSVGIGTTSPLGGLDVNAASGVNSWTYFRGNVNGATNPAASFDNGLAVGWNYSGGLGDTKLLYSTGSGSGPRLDFGSWSGSAISIAMSIKDNNVGIGRTDPSAKLEVIGRSVFAANTSYTAGDALTIGNDATFADYDTANSISLNGIANSAESGLRLGSGGGTLYGKSGNIGIGTISPTALLDVAGSASLSGNLAFNGTGTNSIYALNNSNLSFMTSPGGTNNTVITTIVNNGLGAFSTTSQGQLPQIKINHTTVTSTVGASTYVYVLGGNDGSTQQSTVYKATVNGTTGDIGAFSTASQGQLPQTLGWNKTVTATIGASTYVYVLGGGNGFGSVTLQSTVYKATLNGTTGDVGTFSTASQGQLPTVLYTHTTATSTIGASTYVYVLGGDNGAGNQSTVYKATVNGTTGDIGAFSTASQGQLPQVLGEHTTVTATIGGTTYVYVLGGGNVATSTVYKAAIDTNGNIGTFSTASQGQLPLTLIRHTTVVATLGGTNNYVYVLGGFSGGAQQSTVYMAAIDTSGNIGAFSTASQAQLPQIAQYHTTVTSTIGGTSYIYVLGGNTLQSTVYKAAISSTSTNTNTVNALFTLTNNNQIQANGVITASSSSNLKLQASGATAGNGNNGSIYFLDSSGTTRGRFDTAANTAFILSAFSTTSQAQLPAVLLDETSQTATIGSSTYIYVLGGANTSGTAQSTVYKAAFNSSTGDVGAFATTNQGQLPQIVYYPNSAMATIGSSTYIYVLGGFNGTANVSTVYKANINTTTGDIGAFSTASQGQLPALLNRHETVTAIVGSSTYIYVMGGNNSTGPVGVSTVYKATINGTTGDIGTFSTASQAQLPTNFNTGSAFSTTISGTTYIYATGGFSGGISGYGQTAAAFSTVYKATVDSNGNVGAFSTTSQGQLPQMLQGHRVVVTPSNTLYIIGGANSAGAVQSTVYVASINSSGDIAIITPNSNGFPITLTNHEAATTTIGGTTYLYTFGGISGANQSSVYKANVTSRTAYGVLYAGAVDTFNADIAENYPVSDTTIGPADVVSLPLNSGNQLIKSSVAYDQNVMGVISTNPGITLGSNDSLFQGDQRPVALKGRVPVKVSSENGDIKVGDSLTSSTIAGTAMKATKAGQIIGKALESFSCENNSTIQQSNSNDSNEPGSSASDSANFGLVTPSQNYCTRTVLVFVNVGYNDPAPPIITAVENMRDYTFTKLASQGEALRNLTYQVTDNFGNVVDRAEVLAGAVIGNLRAGAINASQIFADAIQTNIINADKIISPIAQIDTIHTNLISPIGSDSSIALKLSDTKFEILNTKYSTGSAVSSFDNQGNATFSGQLSASSGQFGDATISGTLHAGKILASDIVGLNIQAATVSANYITNVTNVYNSSPSASSNPFPTLVATSIQPSASSSGTNPYTLNANNYISVAPFASQLAYVENLNAATAEFSQGLMVFGPTSLSDTSVVGQLSIDGNLILAGNSINVLGGDLQIQPLKQGGLSVMAGLFYIDTNGNIKVGGNAEFAKNVTVKGTLAANVISPIPGNDLTVNLGDSQIRNSKFEIRNSTDSAGLSINSLGDLVASGSGTFSKLNLGLVSPAFALSNTEVIATGSAGTASIKANQTQITINNPQVTEKSLIYVTPKSNQVIYLMRQVPGVSFTVGVSTPTYVDIPFNWIIVN